MIDQKSKSNIVVKKDCVITNRMKDYTGMIVNNFKIIKPAGRNSENRMLWECECMLCHKKYYVIPNNLKGSTCECNEHHVKIFKMSFYDWCIQNNHQDYIDLWDDDKNSEDIHEVGFSSDRYFYFKCKQHPEHNSEKYRLSNITQGNQKGISCKQCNSFAQWGIDKFGDDFLNSYWDYELNTVNPWHISRRSGEKIWIKCENNIHASHQTTAHNCVKYECRCPDCMRSLNLSSLHLKCISFLKTLGLKVNTEYDCSLSLINPDTNQKLPYDIEVVDYKLIIEINGIQHYSTLSDTCPWLGDKTPYQYLEKRRKYDFMKKKYVINQNYHYLEIPYYMEENDLYKKFILGELNYLRSHN